MIGRTPSRQRKQPTKPVLSGVRPKSRDRNRASALPSPSAWLLNHARAFFFSLGKLSRTPVASTMTITVIGIAIALPVGLSVLLSNLERVSGGWGQGVQITLYLKKGVTPQNQTTLIHQLKTNPRIARIRLISPAEGLKELAQTGNFGNALDTLPENPLPTVIVVYPQPNGHQAQQMAQLRQTLASNPDVDEAQMNLAWVKRLYAMTDLATRTIWIVGSLLALSVLLVIGNTIRLDILNHRQEIEVAKLIGATDAFIRRPFLYGGFWLGLLGGLLALIIVTTSLEFLSGPVNQLSGLYGSHYRLSGLGLQNMARLLFLSILFGLGGSWLAVGRHLHKIEPQ